MHVIYFSNHIRSYVAISYLLRTQYDSSYLKYVTKCPLRYNTHVVMAFCAYPIKYLIIIIMKQLIVGLHL